MTTFYKEKDVVLELVTSEGGSIIVNYSISGSNQLATMWSEIEFATNMNNIVEILLYTEVTRGNDTIRWYYHREKRDPVKRSVWTPS